MKHIIEIKNLKKRFGDIQAVDDLSFHVNEGELFAFLGINGAGKSTTISIICDQIAKDSGKVYVNGIDLDVDSTNIKTMIGVVFQNSVLDKQLTVLDNLMCRAALYGLSKDQFNKKIEELNILLDLKPLLNRTLGKLSGGQKRRVDIARALIHNPKILILDEPTTGLDPQTRQMVWNVVEKLRKDQNITVFLTTHYMEETRDADYVVIIDHGKIVGQGTPNELKNEFTTDYINLYNVTEEEVKKLNISYDVINDGFRIKIDSTAKAKELINEYPELFNDFEVVKGKMDDVFLNATGRSNSGGIN
jgi:multidrug/hemolysin transport system ATP-binding protein